MRAAASAAIFAAVRRRSARSSEHLEERVGEVGVELLAAAAAQLVDALVGGQRVAIRTLERHRVVGVDDAHGAGDERDARALELVGVALAVPALVVVAHAEDEVLVEQRVDDLGAEHRVLAHRLPLLAVELAGLEQHAVGDADLADVVQEGGLFDLAHELLGPAELLRQEDVVGRDAGGVAEGVVVLGVEGGAERLEVVEVHALDVAVEQGVLDRQRDLGADARQQVASRRRRRRRAGS